MAPSDTLIMISTIRSGCRKRIAVRGRWTLKIVHRLGKRKNVHSNFHVSLKEIFSFFVCTKKETKKNANTLRSYSALSRSYDEELGLVVTRASDRLRHLTLLSVAAPNASSAIVCGCASLSLRLIGKTSAREYTHREDTSKSIPFRALMPAKTAPARYEFISSSLKREDLGEITAPFRIKGVLGISDKLK